MLSGSRAGRAMPLAGALRALGGALAAGVALRTVLARVGGGVRVDKAAQEEALRSCLASAAARRAGPGGGHERRKRSGQRLDRGPGAAGTARRPGPDRLPLLLGFAPPGWGREMTLEDLAGYTRRPAPAGVARHREADRGERAIGGW